MSIRPSPIVLCAVLAVVGCSPRPEAPEEAYAPRPLTAAQVADLIAADGTGHTVAVLSGPADPTGIDKVFAGVATGAPDWLALVPAIQPEVDGRHAEGLQAALATALTHNAPGVLALMPDHALPRFVCGSPGTPDARAITVKAVRAVADPDLRAARTECLRRLDGDQAPVGR